MERLRVGVIGCGLISQIMHLPYLRELDDMYELRALCDISPGTLELVADAYDVKRRFTSWRDLVSEDLDAVFVVTNGSHAEPAIAAAGAGRHVFVEKPLCLTLEEADRMAAAAVSNDVRLMVGYMKRYDPGFVEAARRVARMDDLRFLRLTTLEAPADEYVGVYPILRRQDLPAEVVVSLDAERKALAHRAIGSDAGPELDRAYLNTLLDSAIHELNMLRALVGDPLEITSAAFWAEGRCLHAVLTFPGELRASLSWLTLPGLRRYRQEIACYAGSDRLTISFPSPYLRNAPTPLILEEQDAEATWEREMVVSYDEAFRLELIHFHECVTRGEQPRTGAADARRDIELSQAIVRAARAGSPVPFASANANASAGSGPGLAGQ